jgi:lauroyl/myristoyl acyltransferase
LENLERYREEGIVGIGYHIGPISAVPVMMAILGYDTTFLLRPDTIKKDLGLTIDQINERLEKFCKTNGLGKITGLDSLSTFAVVQMKKRLRKGQILFIYPDTVHSSEADCVAVPFFNSKIAGHLGIAKIYRMTNAKLVPIEFGWHEDGREYFHVKEPLDIHQDLSDEQITCEVYRGMVTRLKVDLAQWLRVRFFDLLKHK